VTDLEAQKNPERLEIEELTALQPGLARLMPEIGARFWKAFYAARAQNWPLATWQLQELRKLMRLAMVTRPKYTDDLEEFIHDDLELLLEALDRHDLTAFEGLYHQAVDAANQFHRRWSKPWIVWKLPDDPPPDLDLTPVP
jgi:non-ribosomal peptide synthetase component F